MKKSTIAAVSVAAMLSLSTQSSAQEADFQQVEQGFFKDVLEKVACRALVPAANRISGGIIGDIVGSDVLGLCPSPTSEEGAESGVTSTSEPNEQGVSSNAIVGMRPAININLLKVTPPEQNPSISVVDASTVFEAGSGFSALVSHNSPGYLEVWSLDDSGATFIEGTVLTNAGSVTLPNSARGYYRFNTSNGSDYLRLRFLPCQPAVEEGFILQENQQVADLVGRTDTAVRNLTNSLPSCPFSTSVIDMTVPNDRLFDSAFPEAPAYSEETKSFLAVSSRGGALTTRIELKRR